LNEAAKSLNKRPVSPAPELVTQLVAYDFPGNIRELKAVTFDAVARHESGKLSVENFKTFIDSTLPPAGNVSMGMCGEFPTLKETEDYLIAEALNHSQGNQSAAASLLGISSQALNKRLRRKKKKLEQN
jgi:DNA-binding NtrC family response regulator